MSTAGVRSGRRFALITFDLDDTLWSVQPVLLRAEQRVEAWMHEHCPDVALRFDRSALMQLRVQTHRERPELRHSVSALRIEAMRRALLDTGYGQAEAARLAQAAFDVFMHWRHAVEPFGAVDTVLGTLAREHVLGALTNGNADVFRIAIGRHFRFAFTRRRRRHMQTGTGALPGRAECSRRDRRACAARRRSPRARRAGRAPGRHDGRVVQSRGSRA
jgi:phosphoglycolate phosphatase-like HAD superfamily hydrolase